MKRHPFRTNGSEFADLAFSNVAATFHQCLSPIVSKLSTQDKKRKRKKEKKKFRQGLLVKHIQELVKNLSRIRWFQALYVGGRGLATIDRLLTVSLVVEKL